MSKGARNFQQARNRAKKALADYHTQEPLADEDIVYVPVSVDDLPNYSQSILCINPKLDLPFKAFYSKENNTLDGFLIKDSGITHYLKPVKLTSLRTPKNK